MHMSRIHALSLLLGLALVLAIVHNLAYEYFWYWKFWWLDLLMHLGGGVFIAGIVILSGALTRLASIVGVVLIFGVAWEVFEFVTKVSYSRAFVLDTGLDLLMDVIGAVALWGIVGWWNRNLALPLPAERDASPGPTSY